jgi:hypothetical protein
MHPIRRPGGDCALCGFEARSVSPSDALVAIRSYPRRYRRVLQEAMLDLNRGDDLIRHRPPGQWSALELTAHVRDSLHVFENRLRRIVFEDRPSLAEAELETPPAAAHDQGVELVLASFLSNADQFAHAATSVTGDDWLRAGTLGEIEVSALDVLREAVHDGSHHLRDVEKVLAAAREALP